MAEKFFRLYFALFVSFAVNHSLPSFAAFATNFSILQQLKFPT